MHVPGVKWVEEAAVLEVEDGSVPQTAPAVGLLGILLDKQEIEPSDTQTCKKSLSKTVIIACIHVRQRCLLEKVS